MHIEKFNGGFAPPTARLPPQCFSWIVLQEPKRQLSLHLCTDLVTSEQHCKAS